MTAPGLQAFLGGTTPHLATRRKLEAWLVRMEAGAGEGTGVESATAALRVLLRDLPPSREAAAGRRLVRHLEEIYGSEGAPRPVWLDDLLVGMNGGEE
jgi:hypothetical protein